MRTMIVSLVKRCNVTIEELCPIMPDHKSDELPTCWNESSARYQPGKTMLEPRIFRNITRDQWATNETAKRFDEDNEDNEFDCYVREPVITSNFEALKMLSNWQNSAVILCNAMTDQII